MAYTLYDPNVGELTIKIHKNVEDLVRILRSVLADYLNQKTSATQTIGEYYVFEKENGAYKISMSRMKTPVTGVPIDTVHTVDELGLRMKAFHELPFSFREHTH